LNSKFPELGNKFNFIMNNAD